MQLPWTRGFDEESSSYSLRFTCEDCAHFDARSGRCRHEWPNETHRRNVAADDERTLDFCKEFELC